MSEHDKKRALSRKDALKAMSVFGMATLLVGCKRAFTGEIPEAQPIGQLPTLSPTEKAPVMAPEVTETTVNDGEGLQKAVLRSCQEKTGEVCYWNDFQDIGILWFRNGQPLAYITEKNAFTYLDFASDLGGTHTGDKVIYGAVDEVKKTAQQLDLIDSLGMRTPLSETMTKVTYEYTNRLRNGVKKWSHIITFSGGDYLGGLTIELSSFYTDDHQSKLWDIKAKDASQEELVAIEGVNSNEVRNNINQIIQNNKDKIITIP